MDVKGTVLVTINPQSWSRRWWTHQQVVLYHAITFFWTTDISYSDQEASNQCIDRSAAAAHHNQRQEKKGGSDRNQRKETERVSGNSCCPHACYFSISTQIWAASGPSIHHNATKAVLQRERLSERCLTPQSFTPISSSSTHSSLITHCNAKKGVHEHIRTAQDGSPLTSQRTKLMIVYSAWSLILSTKRNHRLDPRVSALSNDANRLLLV
jgi:hypothetical protein